MSHKGKVEIWRERGGWIGGGREGAKAATAGEAEGVDK